MDRVHTQLAFSYPPLEESVCEEKFEKIQLHESISENDDDFVHHHSTQD